MSKKPIEQEIIFPPPGIKTHYGLKVVRELWAGETEPWFKFDLPDGVQVLPFNEEGKVIAVRQERNGVSYLGLVGETMNRSEQDVFRKAVQDDRSLEIARIACAAAKRGLLEETGYEAEEAHFLSSVLVNSSRGIPAHCFVVARNCRKIKEIEAGIRVELWPPEEFFLAIRAQFLAWPAVPKAGGNSLLALSIGLKPLKPRQIATQESRGTLTVVAIRGLPLSGKTTLASSLSKELGWTYIDVDAMRPVAAGRPNREENPNPYISPELMQREGEDMRIAYQCMHEAVRANISFGRSVIVTATYSRRTAQRFLLDIVENHQGARLKGIRCNFNDTEEEIRRRLHPINAPGGCKTLEHYLRDKLERHDYTDLWGVLEVNTSQPLEVCVAQALEFINS